MSVWQTIASIGHELLEPEGKETEPPPEPQEDIWQACRGGPMSADDIEAMYTSVRGTPVSERPLVVLATATYHEPYELIRRCGPSRRAVAEDLEKHGIGVGKVTIHGDSLVQRMRQRAVHQFLKTEGTHLLWWDADIEALDPTCVRKMIQSGHDVIAGACPFKNNTRNVVVNLLPETVHGQPLKMQGGCIEVQDAGTGFMLVSRKALVSLMGAHPELRHYSMSHGEQGEPLWAIYDTAIINGIYESEDFCFCRLWQQLGGKVYVYVPAKFRHLGIYAYEGSLEEQWGLTRVDPTP